MGIIRATLFVMFAAGLSSWLMLTAANAVVSSQRALIIGGSAKSTGPALQGALLLEDSVSFLLLEDAASHICFEGGSC